MKRIVIAALLISSALVPFVVDGFSAPARADVVAFSMPTAVAISDQTLTFSGTVRLGRHATGVRSASLWFRYPNTLSATRIGTAASHRRGVLLVSGNLDTTRIIPGLNQIRVEDDRDGDSRTITLDLRRLSRVKVTNVEFRSDGRVSLAVKLSHYDPKLGRFAPSKLSPVRLQEKVNGTWVTVGQVTTGSSGRARVLVNAAPGLHSYRAVRPHGATVLAATSKTVITAGN